MQPFPYRLQLRLDDQALANHFISRIRVVGDFCDWDVSRGIDMEIRFNGNTKIAEATIHLTEPKNRIKFVINKDLWYYSPFLPNESDCCGNTNNLIE